MSLPPIMERLGVSLNRRSNGRTHAAFVLIAWASVTHARAQTPPIPSPNLAVAPPVEERLRRLEEVNQQLLEQNRQLNLSLQAITERLNIPSPGAPNRTGREAAAPPAANEANPSGTRPSTASAYGGVDLMSPARGGPADRSGGPSANTVENVPSRGASYGGGDLISFAPDDPADATGVRMNSRFGRRFTNNGLWF